MGVTGLSAKLRNFKLKLKNLSDLRGKVCGLDVLVVLHTLYSQQDFAINFHSIPSVDLYLHVEKMLDTFKQLNRKCWPAPINFINKEHERWLLLRSWEKLDRFLVDPVLRGLIEGIARHASAAGRGTAGGRVPVLRILLDLLLQVTERP